LSFFKKQIPRAHVEIMHGRLQDNDRYIEKEGDLTVWGQKPDQGRRTDIVGLKRKIEEGHHPMDLAFSDEGFTSIVGKFDRFSEKMYQHQMSLQKHTAKAPKVYIKYDCPDDTEWLNESFGVGKWHICPDNIGKWFDGCDRADVLVFNRMSADNMLPFYLFEKLTGSYAKQVPVKGGFTYLYPKAIVFYSNMLYTDWYEVSAEDHDLMYKRVYEFPATDANYYISMREHFLAGTDGSPSQVHGSQESGISQAPPAPP